MRLIGLVVLCAGMALAQQSAPQAAQPPSQQPSTAAPAASAARPQDVDSVDHIIAALYDVISGPAGPRDWSRFKSLFIPESRLIPTGRHPDGAYFHRVLSPDDYVQRATELMAREPFYESELARRQERFGSVVHAFSTYESRRTPSAAPFSRGINSIQLLYDGQRWWVVTIFWDSERAENPIPAEYLKK